MRRLAGEPQHVPLDAEGPEHDAGRFVHRLEHGTLLDMQLEVRRRGLELRARVQRRVQLDAVLRDGVGQGHAVRVLP